MKPKEKKQKKIALKDCQGKLAEGETTGHAHRVTVAVMENPITKIREFEGPTVVTHEEHKPIEIPEGAFVSGIVRERDHMKETTRRVID